MAVSARLFILVAESIAGPAVCDCDVARVAVLVTFYVFILPFPSHWISLLWITDTVTDFSWEPRGERFAIVSSNDPNLGNPGPGITIKTDVSFYSWNVGRVTSSS